MIEEARVSGWYTCLAQNDEGHSQMRNAFFIKGELQLYKYNNMYIAYKVKQRSFCMFSKCLIHILNAKISHCVYAFGLGQISI